MELIVISDRKLKIILDDGELESRGIALDELESDCDGDRCSEHRDVAKAALRELLDEARDRTGFDASHAKVYIQLYPSRGGGCEIYVTKLTDAADDYPVKAAAQRKRGAGVGVRIIAPENEIRGSDTAYYLFENLDGLCGACRRLSYLTLPAVKSEVRRDEYGRYLLSVDEKRGEYDLDCLGDYGRKVQRTAAIGEHSALLCSGDAIKVFSEL